MASLAHSIVLIARHNWYMPDKPLAWDWARIPPLPPLIRANGSGAARWQTTVRLCHNDTSLFVCFDCADGDIWGTYTERDQPIYDEEVVELFISVGEATPMYYYEIEQSKRVLFDAQIYIQLASAPI